MPATRVYFYAEEDGSSPPLDWLRELRSANERAFAACRARILLLAAMGHELRRPHADFLRDGIYELRAKQGRTNYRLLYFLHGKDAAVLAHGLAKERRVPDADIERAIQRRSRYAKDPSAHQATQDL